MPTLLHVSYLLISTGKPQLDLINYVLKQVIKRIAVEIVLYVTGVRQEFFSSLFE